MTEISQHVRILGRKRPRCPLAGSHACGRWTQMGSAAVGAAEAGALRGDAYGCIRMHTDACRAPGRSRALARRFRPRM
ncbi:hypothetical protein XOC_1293 [Xanthomonas oryzae pv. oryzicola BLS256]|uniref:Uncharacterized protein n=1 Tax=Xanthomonas oryzae pv. oryzicola (strain BLS256) TaxID=383407 RepID=G7TH92_XANOB|nr:hypothetical protein XOC_1293 [Xanthomonas oryzae pv. oryzicola BLS256]